MDELTNPTTIWGAAGGALTAAIAGFFWFRKTMASTAAGVAGDRAEVNMISVLQEENASLRTRLDAAERERNAMFQQVADLTADLKIVKAAQDVQARLMETQTQRISDLTATNQELTQEVGRLRVALEQRP